MKIHIPILFLLIVSGCAFQPPLIKHTPSGYPEGTASGLSVDDMKSAIIAGCSKRNLQIYDVNSNQVVCGRAMGGAEALFSPMTVKNPYSTVSEIKVRFTIYKSGDGVNIIANQWIETQLPFHQTDRRETRSNEVMNDIQQFMFDIGTK